MRLCACTHVRILVMFFCIFCDLYMCRNNLEVLFLNFCKWINKLILTLLVHWNGWKYSDLIVFIYLVYNFKLSSTSGKKVFEKMHKCFVKKGVKSRKSNLWSSFNLILISLRASANNAWWYETVFSKSCNFWSQTK